MSKLLPFGTLPGHWGLVGKTRDVAKAEYELTGYDLEQKLLEINMNELDPEVVQKKRWEIEVKYGKMSTAQLSRLLVDQIKDEKQKLLATLELDMQEGKLDSVEYAKRDATIRGEPWVNVVNMDFTKKSSLEGSFELDWNEPFVEKLKAEGYTGPTNDNIVNQWFMELCRNIAMEEFDGTGDFTADSAANIETMKRWNSETLPSGKKLHK